MKETQDNPAWPLLKLYELISGPADRKRPWDEIRRLFLDGARLRMVVRLEDGSEKLREWTLDEFARDAGEFYSQDGFWEREVSRRVECFGSIAQGLTHVFQFQIRIRYQNVSIGHAVGHHINNSCHGYAQPTNAGHPAHLVGIHTYPGENHYLLRSENACAPHH